MAPKAKKSPAPKKATAKKGAVKKTISKKSPAKKTTAKKEKKEKKGYKQASSAYMFYAKENREKIKKKNPDASFGELGKLLGEAWKAVTAKEKVKYEKLAEKDKARAAKDKAAWEKTQK